MKITKILFLLLFVSTVTFAQLTNLEKQYGVSLEIKDRLLNELFEAQQLFDNGQYRETLQILLRVAKADPVIFNTYESIYNVSKKLKFTNQEIMNCFKTGKKIYFDSDEISFFLGELHCINKDYKNALIEYNQAIAMMTTKKIKSNHTPYYFSGRGYCNMQLTSFSDAEKDYSQFLARKPNDAVGLLNRGFCFYKLGNMQKAKSDWKIASEKGSSEAKNCLNKISQ